MCFFVFLTKSVAVKKVRPGQLVGRGARGTIVHEERLGFIQVRRRLRYDSSRWWDKPGCRNLQPGG